MKTKPISWPIQNNVLVFKDSTHENGTFQLPKQKWVAGWYKIVATTQDKYGESVRTETFIQLLPNSNNQNITAPIAISKNKSSAAPGEKFEYSIATGFEKIWLIHALTKMNANAVFTYPVITNKNSAQFSESILESDRGGMAVSYVFIQHNRVYKGEETFYVPWKNKDLTIEYSSFRDKLLPGSKEKWTATIKGNKGEKIGAEILAAMYDASLDQFEPQSWSTLNIWPTIYNAVQWNIQGFNRINSENHYDRFYDYLNTEGKSYDRLLYTEGLFYRYRDRQYYARSDNSKVPPPPPPAAAMGKLEEVVVVGYGDTKNMVSNKAPEITENKNEANNQSAVQVRKNFNETAFFLPELRTDSNGNIQFEYTIPEALTEWKLMTFAHSKNLASGYIEKRIVTQKPLMVQPNAPRFFERVTKWSSVLNLST
jgi:hypothetical protein